MLGHAEDSKQLLTCVDRLRRKNQTRNEHALRNMFNEGQAYCVHLRVCRWLSFWRLG